MPSTTQNDQTHVKNLVQTATDTAMATPFKNYEPSAIKQNLLIIWQLKISYQTWTLRTTQDLSWAWFDEQQKGTSTLRTGCISSYDLPKNGTTIMHNMSLIIRNMSYLAAVSCKCCPRAPEVSRETEQGGIRSPALSRATSVPVTVDFVKEELTDKLIGLKTQTVSRTQHKTGLRRCGQAHALLASLCGWGDWIRGLVLRPFLNRVGASSSNTWTSSLRPSVEAGQSVRRGRWKMIINNETRIYNVKQGGLQTGTAVLRRFMVSS